MISIKQIFIILSVMSLASAKKGISARNTRVEGERRGLKKGSKRGSLGGGSGFQQPDGTNRDGTTVGELIEPAQQDCIPFDDARKWLSADYPGDTQCRQSDQTFTISSSCCRVFSFTDTNGPQKWLLYDISNKYRDLMCVCNENTAAGNGGTDAGNGGTDAGNGGTIDTGMDRGGSDTGAGESIPGIPDAPTTPPAPTPTPPPAPNQCSAANIGATQLSLQDSPYMVPCEDSSPCGNNKCCFSNYCVCWPVSQLVEGTSYCL